MPYQVNYTDPNSGSITVEDNTVNSQLSLSFPGNNATGYPKIIGDNFLHLLENFANATAPDSPVIGQLWYDATASQLKVFDGSNFVAAGNVKKGTARPTAAIVGDLFADSTLQQLFMWTGSNWLLVGPQFSESQEAGIKVETITSTGSPQVVVALYVNSVRLAILSTSTFTPNPAIDGYTTILPGINLVTDSTNSPGIPAVYYELNGVATYAKNLVTGEGANREVVALADLAKLNEPNEFTHPITIISKEGINLLGAKLSVSENIGTIGNVQLINETATADTDIIIGSQVVLRVSTTDSVLSSNLQVSGNTGLTVDNSVTIAGTSSASLVTAGGASIAKNLSVAGSLAITGESTTASIVPADTNVSNLGTALKKWNAVYADSIVATNITGNVVGTISSASSAGQLQTSVPFAVTGDATSSAPVQFDGTQVAINIPVTLAKSCIANKSAVSLTNLEGSNSFLLSTSADELKRVTLTTLSRKIGATPVGAVIMYAGNTIPEGYLLCDGSLLSSVTYSLLYGAISTQFGSSTISGILYFKLPDFRGRVPLGSTSMTNGLTGVSARPAQEANTVTLQPLGNRGGSLTAAVGTGGTINITGGTNSLTTTDPFLAMNYLIYTGKY
jgi:hypothetical protein